MEGAYGSEHSTGRGEKAGCNREQIGRLYMISSTPFWCDAIDACEPRWRDNGEKTGGSYGRQGPFFGMKGFGISLRLRALSILTTEVQYNMKLLNGTHPSLS